MSKTIYIFLAGMQHQHYASEVGSAFSAYIGSTVSLRKEDDNRWDIGRAVASYLNYEMLAYVTGDSNKTMVRQILDCRGRKQIHGTLVRFCKARDKNESDMLQVAVECPDEASQQEELTEDDDWTQLTWTGPTLPLSPEANQLHAVVDEVLDMLHDGADLTAHMSRGLDMIAQLSWADISREMRTAYSDILRHFTLDAERCPEMVEAAVRMQQIITHIGSPEVRERVYNRMVENAQSAEVSRIIAHEGYTLDNLSPRISQVLVNMISTDVQGMIGRIWYMGIPLTVLNGVMSSLTYLLRLLIDKGENLTDAHVPIEQRVIEVGKLLKGCEGMPVEFSRNICSIIATNVPMLNETDLERLRLASKGTPQIGVQINHSALMGNNMADNIVTPDGKMPVPPLNTVPIDDMQKLLTPNPLIPQPSSLNPNPSNGIQ